MKAVHVSPILLSLGFVACAHAAKPYTFSSEHAANGIDVVVKTLQENGLRPAQIDRQQGVVTTYWFDTGYPFGETEVMESVQYPTDVFLRYRISVTRQDGKDTVVLTPEAQRCAPLDVTVTAEGISGSCSPMPQLFPTQQEQVNTFGEKLRQAMGGAATVSSANG